MYISLKECGYENSKLSMQQDDTCMASTSTGLGINKDKCKGGTSNTMLIVLPHYYLLFMETSIKEIIDLVKIVESNVWPIVCQL